MSVKEIKFKSNKKSKYEKFKNWYTIKFKD